MIRLTFAAPIMAVALLISAVAAQAQSLPNAKIIVVDFDRVSRESLVGKDIAAQVESNRVSLEQFARELQQDLGADEQTLMQRRSIVGDEQFQEEVRGYQQRRQQAQGQVQELTQQSRRAMQQANLEVQRVLRPIVKDVMENKGANLVLDKALVSQHAGGLDVTTEVIEKLDESMPSFEVSLPSVPE